MPFTLLLSTCTHFLGWCTFMHKHGYTAPCWESRREKERRGRRTVRDVRMYSHACMCVRWLHSSPVWSAEVSHTGGSHPWVSPRVGTLSCSLFLTWLRPKQKLIFCEIERNRDSLKVRDVFSRLPFLRLFLRHFLLCGAFNYLAFYRFHCWTKRHSLWLECLFDACISTSNLI